MKQSLLILAALAAGFIGGILGNQAMPQERPRSEGLIRARSFELLDASGNVISFWGVDKGSNIVLAFGSDASSHLGVGLNDPNGNGQRVGIGTTGDIPFIFFKTPDGTKVMNMTFGVDPRPVLWMGDETGPRVRLGITSFDTPVPQNGYWALSFEPDRAAIGIIGGGSAGDRYARGFFWVNKDKVKY